MGFPATPTAHATVVGVNGGTTAGVDTTGANLLIATISYYNGAGASPTPTDFYSNTWVQIGTTQAGSSTSVKMFYVASPTVGAGHTFSSTTSGGSSFSSMEIEAWSGAAASPLDQTSQAAAKQAGSVTPLQDNELLVAGIAPEDLSSVTAIDSGFTISDINAYSGGNNESGAMAYLVETTAAAKNPLWTAGGNAGGTATIIATFKAAATSVFTDLEFVWDPQFPIRRKPQMFTAMLQDDAVWPGTAVATPSQYGWDNPERLRTRRTPRPFSPEASLDQPPVAAVATPADMGWTTSDTTPIRARFFRGKMDETALANLDTQTPTQQGFAWDPQFPIRRTRQVLQPDQQEQQWPFTAVPTPTQYGWVSDLFLPIRRRFWRDASTSADNGPWAEPAPSPPSLLGRVIYPAIKRMGQFMRR